MLCWLFGLICYWYVTLYATAVGWWVGWGALPTNKGLLILDRLAPNVKWRCAAPCSAFSYILQQGLQHGFILFLLFFLLGRVYVCVSLCVCAKCVHRVCVCVHSECASRSVQQRINYAKRVQSPLASSSSAACSCVCVCLRAVCVMFAFSIRRPIPSLPHVLKRNTNSASVRRQQDEKRRDGQAQPTPAVRQLDSSEATAGK